MAVEVSGPIDLGAVASEIERIGFKPGPMTVRATGTFEGDGFRPAGASLLVPLTAPVHPAPDTMAEVTAEVDYAADPPRWKVTGVSAPR